MLTKNALLKKRQNFHAKAIDLESKTIFALSVLEQTGVIFERNTGSSQDSSGINLCQSHSKL